MGVGGEPATGKSTLARKLLALLGPGEPFAFGLAQGTHHGGVFVLGHYGPGPYPGTDRLSMAVQPVAQVFVRQAAEGALPQVRSVFFEGDRLFNVSFLAYCAAYMPESRFYVLESSEKDKARRRKARSDTKPQKFLEGRATKYGNILTAPGNARVETYPSDTPEDLDALAEALAGLLKLVAGPTTA